MRLLPLIALAVVVAVIAGCGSGGSKRPEVVGTVESTVYDDPSKMVIQEADLPGKGYLLVPGGTRSISNKEAAEGRGKAYADKLAAWGRMIAYQVEYAKSGKGSRQIESFASTYSSEAGAKDAFAAGLQEIGSGFKELDPPVGIGNEGHLYEQHTTAAGQPGQIYAVAWRRGRVLAVLLLAGAPGEVAQSEAIDLARKQDDRIRKLVS